MDVDRPPSEPAPSRRGRRGSYLLWLMVVLLALCVGAAAGFQAATLYYSQDRASLSKEQLAALQASQAQREAEIRFLRAQLDTADGETAVQRAARKELEAQLLAQQAELGRVRDQLAFYEQLLPPGPQGSLDIRAATVVRQGVGLRYRVLLMRNGHNGNGPFSGKLQFMAAGKADGQDVTLELGPLQVKEDGTIASPSEAAKETLALNFDQYVRSEGMLALPEGFAPESVTVHVLEGDTVRASRSIELDP
ncbi:DUF6776 family protein [Orrella sp. JC864]|uniref:DUF6776 family protein n=1 Tax=Orrella sp. JC864 TaxID=3120298 RepID=UPI003008DC31